MDPSSSSSSSPEVAPASYESENNIVHIVGLEDDDEPSTIALQSRTGTPYQTLKPHTQQQTASNGVVSPSYVSDMSDAAPQPLSPVPEATPRQPLHASSLHAAAASSNSSTLTVAPLRVTSPSDEVNSPNFVSSPNHAVEKPHPSSTQLAQESRDAKAGHPHNKPASVIAHEAVALTPVVNVINTPAPWSGSGAAPSTSPPLHEHVKHPHPSQEQLQAEHTDAVHGHSHMKPARVIANEGDPTIEVNAHAPWKDEARALANLHHPAHHHVSTSPALPPLDEKIALTNDDSLVVDTPAPNASTSAIQSPLSDGTPSLSPAATTTIAAASSSESARRPSDLANLNRPEFPRIDRWGNIKSAELNAEGPAAASAASFAALSPAEQAKVLAKEKTARAKRLALDQEREGKWVKMVANWDRTVREKPEKLKRRIRKGIPDSMRGIVWTRLTGAIDLMKAGGPTSLASSNGAVGASASGPQKIGAGVYQRYLSMPSRHQDTIARDLARTFPQHILFRDNNPNGDPAGVGEGIGDRPNPNGQGKAKGDDKEGQSSFGRNSLYHVLKAYSLHDEQVGYCFTAEHELLTDSGFMSLAAVEAAEAAGAQILFATLDANDALVYQPATRLIVKPAVAGQKMIEFTHAGEASRWAADSDQYGRSPDQRQRADALSNKMAAEDDKDAAATSTAVAAGSSTDDAESQAPNSNGVSLIVDPQHEMYVQLGNIGQSGKTKQVNRPYHKAKAGTLLIKEERCVRFQSFAPSGLAGEEDACLEFVQALELTTPGQVDAFLELYGYWLGDGSLSDKHTTDRTFAVQFSPKPADVDWLVAQLWRVGLSPGDYTGPYEKENGQVVYNINKPSWVRYFTAEYGLKYDAKDMPSQHKRQHRAGAALLDEADGHITTDMVANFDALVVAARGAADRPDRPVQAAGAFRADGPNAFVPIAAGDRASVAYHLQNPVHLTFGRNRADTGPALTFERLAMAWASTQADVNGVVLAQLNPMVSNAGQCQRMGDSPLFRPVYVQSVRCLLALRVRAAIAFGTNVQREWMQYPHLTEVPGTRVTLETMSWCIVEVLHPSGQRQRVRLVSCEHPGALSRTVEASVSASVYVANILSRREVLTPEEMAVARRLAHPPSLQSENIKSAKWFWWWAWRLRKKSVGLVLDGLRRADGTHAVQERCIWTSSVRFRDDLVRLAIHGGFAAWFQMTDKEDTVRSQGAVAKVPNWRVLYKLDAKSGGARPTLARARDIRTVAYSGRTWCVEVPNGLIFARRAEQVDGVVTKASLPTITGNCQGMGFPAGIFLMYMTEEEAFWMLHCIARGEKYLLNGLWSPEFPLLFQCLYQFHELLKKHCPKMSAHLLSQEPVVDPPLYAVQWFMTCFSYNLPFDIVLRIWDILLAEGPKIIFRLAIFFCKQIEKDVLAQHDFAGVMEVLKNLHNHPMMLTPDFVIEGALQTKITRAELSKLANQYQTQKFRQEQERMAGR